MLFSIRRISLAWPVPVILFTALQNNNDNDKHKVISFFKKESEIDI